MSKLKVVVSQICYPLTMGWYMIRALERMVEKVDLFVIGPFTGNWIPWNNGIQLPMRYVQSPDLPLPQNLIGTKPPFEFIKNDLPWKPDIWIQIDAGFHFHTRPDADVVVLIETDPHVLKDHYLHPRTYSDVIFCMQSPYMMDGDIYLPYAYDSNWIYPQDKPKIHDACAIGLQYEQRMNLVAALRAKGLDVFNDIGLVYNEYREKYNESRVALSWSSLLDTPCRVYEAMGMKVPLVCNRTPDLDKFFVEDRHYLGFDTLEEAVNKVITVLETPRAAAKMSENAYQLVKEEHTWDKRMEFVLEKIEELC